MEAYRLCIDGDEDYVKYIVINEGRMMWLEPNSEKLRGEERTKWKDEARKIWLKLEEEIEINLG